MKNLNTIIIGLLVLAVLAYQSIFVVPEGQKALLTRFAKVVRNGDGAVSLYEPGAGLKIPFVDKVMYLDARVQTLNSTADRFVTSEKKDLIIDSYVKWKIIDFEKFYTANQGSFLMAEDRLRDKITTSLRSQIALLNIREIVAGKSSNEEGQPEEGGSSKREQIMQNTLTITGPGAEKDLGIRIVDVRIMKIELPGEVSSSIYQRMRAEREAVARLHRSQGRQEAEAIRAKADRLAVVKIAEAERQAEIIRGTGDASATKIYADAYSKNPEFFDFLRSMDAYGNSMTNGGNVIVTDSKNEFLKYFR
ncbi:protease modulator HflC [uncultured Ruminobacter sp.]|uniref:protease modulator HflC n=1 Tax=uncultured Ruminobacter sp. TaxID=538947 RepID=UPI0025D82F7D|nr:protease modulator HflC [uncultured Ruminobacter sp.]